MKARVYLINNFSVRLLNLSSKCATNGFSPSLQVEFQAISKEIAEAMLNKNGFTSGVFGDLEAAMLSKDLNLKITPDSDQQIILDKETTIILAQVELQAGSNHFLKDPSYYKVELKSN